MFTESSKISSKQLHGLTAYLLLPQFDGQFEAVEVHPLAVLKGWSRGVMIQQHFQLVGAPRVVQQRSREVLTLLPEFLQ